MKKEILRINLRPNIKIDEVEPFLSGNFTTIIRNGYVIGFEVTEYNDRVEDIIQSIIDRFKVIPLTKSEVDRIIKK